MRRIIVLTAVALFAHAAAAAAAITVNCDRGDSLNRTLAKLDRINAILPITVVVKGTCTEYASSFNADDGFNAGASLEVSGSQGDGVFVTENSHVNLGGVRITGSRHNGLVVVNQSTVAIVVGNGVPPTEISGNNSGGTGARDLYCDSRSLVTGGANIADAPSILCNSLLAGAYEAMPW